MYLLLIILLAIAFGVLGTGIIFATWALYWLAVHWALPALLLLLYILVKVLPRRASTLPPTRCTTHREEN